jgi:phosphoenolpyruvate carboxykinase (GTP)
MPRSKTNNPTRIDMPAYASETSPSPNRSHSQRLTNNKNLLKWIEKMAALTQPAVIHWMDGSQAEYETLCAEMVAGGTFIKLNEEWPGCYYAKSDASDVAHVEDRTYICSLSKDNAGPTNNWVNPFEMRQKLKALLNGCMRGRTMYVPPFSIHDINVLAITSVTYVGCSSPEWATHNANS